MVSRFGGARRAALIFVLALTLAGAFSSAALSQAGGDDDPLAGLSLPDTDDYRALAERMGTTPEPKQSTAAEREASASDYAALSDAQALDLFQAEGEAILDAELFPQVDPPAGHEVAYPDRFTAIVGDDLPAAGHDDPTKPSFDPGAAPLSPSERGRNVMIESTVPLVAPEGGELAPVDGDLIADADHFEAENPAVDAEIPVALDQGIALEAPGVTVTPASTEGAEGVAVSDAVFYPSTDVDTDTLVTPTPTGIEIFWQLRSADSPQSNAIDLELPAGAVLQAAGDGAEVLADGETLVSIPPAMAWDAAGAPVEVSYEVSGATLTVVSPHRDEDVLYPVYVDPIIDYYPFTGGDSTATHYWYSQTSNPEHFEAFYDPLYGALRTRAVPGFYYNEEWAQWVATPIGQSYIETVEFLGIGNWPSDTSGGGAGSCTWASIWSGSYWAEGHTWNSVTNQVTPGYGAWLCGTINDENWSHYTGSDPYPDGEGYGDPESADGSVGIFGFYSTGDTFRPGYAENMLRGANIWRGDRNYPGIPSLPTSGWTNTPYVPLNDAGLGVAGYGVYHRPTNTWPGGGGPGCTGSHTSPCPQSTSLPINNLPEGRHSYELQAYDALWNSSPMVGWEARIDRSAPTVDPLGGSLVANKDNVLPDQTYALDITARDGATSSGDAMRSGVRSIELLIDGENQPRAGNSWTQDCPGADGSCPMTASWSMNGADFSPGQHTIRVSVRDQVGNLDGIAKVLTFNVPADDTEPQVGLQFGPMAADGSSTVQINASDPGSVSTGVTHLDVYVDEVLIQQFDQPCSTGGCQMAQTVNLSALQQPTAHEIVVLPRDGAGNIGFGSGGQQQILYSRFGYNEDLAADKHGLDTAARLTHARNGGSTVVRQSFLWCAMQQAESDEINWDYYKPFFDSLGNTKVIAVLWGTPKWATANPPSSPTGCTSNNKPPANTDSALDAWRKFVKGFTEHYRGQISAIEAWNEPNLGKFWGHSGAQELFNPDPRLFAKVVERARDGIDNAGGGALLLPGGLSPKAGAPNTDAGVTKFMKDATDPAYEHRIRPNAIDGISVHLYTNLEKSTTEKKAQDDLEDKWAQFENGLTHVGHQNDMWITEIGYPTAYAGSVGHNARTQARRLLTAYQAFASRADSFVVHRLLDDPGADPFGVVEKPFGVMSEAGAIKGSPGPADGAYCKLARRRMADSQLIDACKPSP